MFSIEGEEPTKEICGTRELKNLKEHILRKNNLGMAGQACNLSSPKAGPERSSGL